MTENTKITALYSRLSVGDEDRDGGESNSIVNQKAFLERYAQQNQLYNIRHYIDDDESGRFFDRSGYVKMMNDVENGKVGIVIMKDLTRWGRDYLQVGNAMEVFRRHNVRFIAINNGIDSLDQNTLEFAPFINIMSEWYARDISKKVKTGIHTKGVSGKPVATEAVYGYVKDRNNKDYWVIDEEAAQVVRLIFRLFMEGKNRNQISEYLKEERISAPSYYLKDHNRGTSKGRDLNEEKRYDWNKVTLTTILTRQEYCGDIVNFKTTKHYRDKHSYYVDRDMWQIIENVHEAIIDRETFETVQRILKNVPIKRPNGEGVIHPLSGLMYCKDCGTRIHIRTIHKNGKVRHVTYCSEYAKGKARHPKCSSPHRIDVDCIMQNIAEVLRRVAKYALNNKEEFEEMVKTCLAKGQTEEEEKLQKRVPQIKQRIEQDELFMDKLFEDYAIGKLEPERYEQLSHKYSAEYNSLKKELEEIEKQLSKDDDVNRRAKRFVQLVERYCNFEELTPAAINEFISKIFVYERDVKGTKYPVQRVEVYFNYIGRFENELTESLDLSEDQCKRIRKELDETKRERNRAYHRAYSKKHRTENIDKYREYERLKARERRAKKKLQKSA